jgi:signal recognition particle GTPase
LLQQPLFAEVPNITVTNAMWLFEQSEKASFFDIVPLLHQLAMSTKETSAAPEGKQPTTILCIGMAGSGKTTLMQVNACNNFFFSLPLYAE